MTGNVIKNGKTLFGLALIVALIWGANAHEKTLIRQGYLALRHFHILSVAVASEARAMLAEKTGGGVQSTIRAGSSDSQNYGQSDLSYDWEIAPSNSSDINSNLKVIAEQIQSKLSGIVTGEETSLRYYYSHVHMRIEVSVVDSKFFNKQAILVSLKCSTKKELTSKNADTVQTTSSLGELSQK